MASLGSTLLMRMESAGGGFNLSFYDILFVLEFALVFVLFYLIRYLSYRGLMGIKGMGLINE